jgi:hypothetical protein
MNCSISVDKGFWPNAGALKAAVRNAAVAIARENVFMAGFWSDCIIESSFRSISQFARGVSAAGIEISGRNAIIPR